MTDRWFTDRRLLISAVGLILAFGVNAASTIWVTSRWFERMDNRVTAIETSLVDRPGLTQRFVQVETATELYRAEVTSRLDRIEDKVDTIQERLSLRGSPP